MKRLALLILTVGLLNAGAISYPGGPEIGQAAPALRIAKWLGASPQTTARWPVGKVVVLEFWATWCGPCVAAIPHLNDLAEQFKSKPVQFIALTAEEEGVVRSFLEKTPIRAWVGLSADAAFGPDGPYQIRAIPHTVIIDAQGRIAAVTEPSSLTPGLIELCLSNQPLPQTGEAGGQTFPGVVPGQSRIGKRALFQVLIRPPSMTNHVETWSDEGYTLQSGRLMTAISRVFDAKPTRMVEEVAVPKDRYDFYIALPPSSENPSGKTRLEAVFAQSIEVTFGLTVGRELREIEVLLLKTNVNSSVRLAKSTNRAGEDIFDSNEVRGTDQTVGFLAEGLEHALKMPVLDETTLTNRFSFDLKWNQELDHPNPKNVVSEVNQLGLDLVPAKRQLGMVVVRKAPPPKPQHL